MVREGWKKVERSASRRDNGRKAEQIDTDTRRERRSREVEGGREERGMDSGEGGETEEKSG